MNETKGPRDINTIKQDIEAVLADMLREPPFTGPWFSAKKKLNILGDELVAAEAGKQNLSDAYRASWDAWIKSWGIEANINSPNAKSTSFEDGDDPDNQCGFCQSEKQEDKGDTRTRLEQAAECLRKAVQSAEDSRLYSLSYRQRESLHWMAMMLWGVMDTIDELEVTKEAYYELAGCQADIAAVLERIDKEVSTHA